MSTPYPPEKTRYRLAYQPDEQEVSEGSVSTTATSTARAWNEADNNPAPDDAPPPTYDESIAIYANSNIAPPRRTVADDKKADISDDMQLTGGPPSRADSCSKSSVLMYAPPNSQPPETVGRRGTIPPFPSAFPVPVIPVANAPNAQPQGHMYSAASTAPAAYAPGPAYTMAAPAAAPVHPSSYAPSTSGPSPMCPRQRQLTSSSQGSAHGAPEASARSLTPAQILTPPPPSFSRQPSQGVPYSPFSPCALLSLSTDLEDGFPMIPPPTAAQPHPFVTHDVNENDWAHFLGHVKAACSLSSRDKTLAKVAPNIKYVGFMGYLVSKGIESHVKKAKTGPVGEIVDHWNHNFFHPRQMEVTLAQGRVRHSGFGDSPPPDMASDTYGQGNNYSSGSLNRVASSLGSISDEDEDSDPEQDGFGEHSSRDAARRASKRERKASRRQAKAERRQRREEGPRHCSKSGRPFNEILWRLVVSFKQPIL